MGRHDVLHRVSNQNVRIMSVTLKEMRCITLNRLDCQVQSFFIAADLSATRLCFSGDGDHYGEVGADFQKRSINRERSKMGTIKVELIPVEQLKPYERNARRHAEADVQAVAASIQKFGFSDPIGIWRDNTIIEGHGRLEAAKILGMKSVPCIRLDHLNDEQRRAYALAHNKTAELSKWDEELLAVELESLKDLNMGDVGFKVDSIDLPDVSGLFEEAEEKTKEPKTCVCPYCGAVNEVEP